MPELTMEAGRITITDNGNTLFDTNRLNQIRTAFAVLKGSIYIPELIVNDKARLAYKRLVNVGAAPLATHLQGAINVVYTGTRGLAGAVGINGGSRWHSIGGTYVHIWSGLRDNQGGTSTDPSGVGLITFYLAGGSVYCDIDFWHDIIDTGGLQGYVIRAFRLNYYIIPCTYV